MFTLFKNKVEINTTVFTANGSNINILNCKAINGKLFIGNNVYLIADVFIEFLKQNCIYNYKIVNTSCFITIEYPDYDSFNNFNHANKIVKNISLKDLISFVLDNKIEPFYTI